MNQNNYSLIILASGLGTRLRPETLEVPKPLVMINGLPIISYIIKYFRSKFDIESILVSTFYKETQIRGYFRDNIHDVDYGFNYNKANSPGESLLYLIDDFKPDSPLIITFCDYIYSSIDFSTGSSIGLFKESNIISVPGEFKTKFDINLKRFVSNTRSNIELGFPGLFVCNDSQSFVEYCGFCLKHKKFNYTYDIMNGFISNNDVNISNIYGLFNCGEIDDLYRTREILTIGNE